MWNFIVENWVAIYVVVAVATYLFSMILNKKNAVLGILYGIFWPIVWGISLIFIIFVFPFSYRNGPKSGWGDF